MANYLIRNIPAELWREIKVIAAKKGITIKALITVLLMEEIEKEREGEK